MLPNRSHLPGTWAGSPDAVPAGATGLTYRATITAAERTDPEHRLWLQVEAMRGPQWVPLTGLVEWRGGPGAPRPEVSVAFAERPAVVRLIVGLEHETQFGFPSPTFTGV